jgi:hypothetical protein
MDAEDAGVEGGSVGATSEQTSVSVGSDVDVSYLSASSHQPPQHSCYIVSQPLLNACMLPGSFLSTPSQSGASRDAVDRLFFRIATSMAFRRRVAMSYDG